MKPPRLATRLAFIMVLLLAGFGALVALLGWRVTVQHEQESLQRLSHGLAQHIVQHWPHVARPERDAADRAEREALLQMLRVVNPGVQAYVLDANGKVDAYIGEPGMVREHQVDLDAVRAFLGGAPLPLQGTDPMAAPGSGVQRIFSAAMFAPRAGDTRPPGYLYVVLDSPARAAAGSQANAAPAWRSLALLVAVGVAISSALALFLLRRFSLPLERLARRMAQYSQTAPQPSLITEVQARVVVGKDEVQVIGHAFAAMTARIEAQTEAERQQANDHRETMASVAHDLRTPLTALHGHLEALARRPQGPGAALDSAPVPLASSPAPAPQRERLLQAALAQSDKVRRLSQQLFELAALQSSSQLVHRERISIDELVTDAVQKFELTTQVNSNAPAVTLSGAPPGRLELEGDLQLIERALTNLIDNALRHAAGAVPVRVSLRREGRQAHIVVEDQGPGLPEELQRRLRAGQSLREPPLRRSGGGIGGLGMAIAQRVAMLHGGSLTPLPTPQGGTRLCLALPLLA